MSQDPADISEADRKLLSSFRALGVTPKADTKEDLEGWMKSYVGAAASVKEETGPKEHTPTSTWPPATPRLSVFTGSATRKDTEATYDLWKYEVICLQSGKCYKDHVILEAVRRSLRGEAARVAMRLGTQSSLDELLAKFDSIYGAVQVKECALADFYCARQQDSEDVSQWSCRLEDLLSKAVATGKVQQSEMNEMLRCMFWTGLRQQLKDRSGHKFDAIKDFDQLRRAIRLVEQDTAHQSVTTKKTATSKAAQPQAEDTRLQALEGQIHRLTAELNALKQQQSQEGPSQQGHRDRQQGRRNWTNQSPQGGSNASQRSDVPVCFRCGEKGHLKIGCRVRLDHSWRGLNGRKSAAEGRL